VRVENYNKSVDKFNAQKVLEGKNDEVMQFQTPLPKGTAWFLDSSRSTAEQHVELLGWRDEGKLLTDTTTKPRTQRGAKGDVIEWSTNDFVVIEPKSLLCFQALQVSIASSPQELLGLLDMPVPVDCSRTALLQGASFQQLNTMFEMSSGLARAFVLMQLPRDRPVIRTSDVFRLTFGTFALHGWVYHAEDILTNIEAGIPHYAMYNATTRLLYLYPESIVLADSDVLDPTDLFERLLAPPYLFRLNDTHGHARRFVRQVFVKLDSPDILDLPHSNMPYVSKAVAAYRTRQFMRWLNPSTAL
jgi:hypothetical protein